MLVAPATILATSSGAPSVDLYWMHSKLLKKVQRTSRSGTLASDLAQQHRISGRRPSLGFGTVFLGARSRVVPTVDVVSHEAELDSAPVVDVSAQEVRQLQIGHLLHALPAPHHGCFLSLPAPSVALCA